MGLLGWILTHLPEVLGFLAGVFTALKPGLLIRAALSVRDAYRRSSIQQAQEHVDRKTQNMLDRMEEDLQGYQAAADRLRSRLDRAEDRAERAEARLQAFKESLCETCPNRGSAFDVVT